MDMIVLIFLSMICAVCDRRADVFLLFADVPACCASWTVPSSCTASGKWWFRRNRSKVGLLSNGTNKKSGVMKIKSLFALTRRSGTGDDVRRSGWSCVRAAGQPGRFRRSAGAGLDFDRQSEPDRAQQFLPAILRGTECGDFFHLLGITYRHPLRWIWVWFSTPKATTGTTKFSPAWA